MKYLLIAIVLLFAACSKDDETKPAPQIEVKITSNYKYPMLRVLKNGNLVAQYNFTGNKRAYSQPFTYTVDKSDAGDYTFIASAVNLPSEADSFMLNNNRLFVSMVIQNRGTTICDSTAYSAPATYVAEFQYSKVIN